MTARELQEYLCLHGYDVVIDGDLGPATQQTATDFCYDYGLPCPTDWHDTARTHLSAYLRRPVASLRYGPVILTAPSTDFLRELLLWESWRHIAAAPHEIGGQNAGPFVRAYMDGNEGRDFPWCAGYVAAVLATVYNDYRAFAESGGLIPGLPFADVGGANHWWMSSTAWAARAKQADRLVTDPARVRRGDLFVIVDDSTANPPKYRHIGVVASHITPPDGTFLSHEGNTNNTGSPEGIKVCALRRSAKGKHFISMVAPADLASESPPILELPTGVAP